MKSKEIKEITASGLFIALGLVLPVIFHMFDQGSTFLPMHIPVLLAGFTLSLPYAAAVGIATPLLSSALTGMPPLYPVLPYMVFELAVYAVAASLLSRKMKLNVYLSLIISMVAGRITAGAAVWAMISFFGAKLPGPLAFMASAVTGGLPGISIQVIVIPPLVLLLRKSGVLKDEGLKVG